MAHWSKIGKDLPRKLLGNRVFALTFASSSAQLQSVQEEEDTAQAPARNWKEAVRYHVIAESRILQVKIELKM